MLFSSNLCNRIWRKFEESVLNISQITQLRRTLLRGITAYRKNVGIEMMTRYETMAINYLIIINKNWLFVPKHFEMLPKNSPQLGPFIRALLRILSGKAANRPRARAL